MDAEAEDRRILDLARVAFIICPESMRQELLDQPCQSAISREVLDHLAISHKGLDRGFGASSAESSKRPTFHCDLQDTHSFRIG